MPVLITQPSTISLGWVGSGIECLVFSGWKDDEVIKTYDSEEEAVDARWRQREAAEISLAPEVRSEVFEIYCDRDEDSMHDRNTGCRYAYVSQRVEPVPRGEDNEILTEMYDKREALKDALREADIPAGDLHFGNIGVMPDGSVVCIDFGGASMECG